MDENESLYDRCSYFMRALSEQKFYEDMDVVESIIYNYPKMLEELQHMRENRIGKNNDFESNIEYYSAYLYPEHLIELENKTQQNKESVKE